MKDAISQLNDWLLETVKSAAMDSEGTSHPSAQGDSGTQPAQVGERGSENESDVASQIPAETVNEASGSEAEGAGRGEDTPVTDIGTKAAPTGEDASVETSSTKETKEDPGTSHPAATDNASVGDGNKYAQARQLGDSILSDIAVADAAATQASARQSDGDTKSSDMHIDHVDDSSKSKKEKEDDKSKMPPEMKEKSDDKSKKEDEKKSSSGATSTETTPGEGETDQSKEASTEAAKAAEDAGRQAAEAVVKAADISEASAEDKAGMIDSIVKSAHADAKNLASYMHGYSKEAMPIPAGEVVDPAAAGVDPAAVGVDPAAAGVDPVALAALAGEAVPGAAPVAPEGGIPAGVEEVVAPEGGGGDEGGLAELAAMLAEAGITPEEVMAMVSAGGEAGGDAVPAEVPGDVPGAVVGEEISEEEGAKVAKATNDGKAAFDQLSQTEKKAALVNAIKYARGQKAVG